MSQILTVVSSDPLTTRLPSAEIANDDTSLECPASVRTSAPVSTSHICTMASSDFLKVLLLQMTRFPSAEIATELTFKWIFSVLTTAPVSMSQILTVDLKYDPLTTRFPSAEIANDDT